MSRINILASLRKSSSSAHTGAADLTPAESTARTISLVVVGGAAAFVVYELISGSNKS